MPLQGHAILILLQGKLRAVAPSMHAAAVLLVLQTFAGQRLGPTFSNDLDEGHDEKVAGQLHDASQARLIPHIQHHPAHGFQAEVHLHNVFSQSRLLSSSMPPT